FILTLMSVYWEEGRKELEEFCREARKPKKGKPGPFNYFMEPDPDQLLRVSIGVGFRRARLKYAYLLLRGKDLETDVFSPEQRDRQFAILMRAQEKTLDLQNWHEFLRVLEKSGFRSSKMVSSKLTLIYTYVLYLIGKEELKIAKEVLDKAIGRWYFMAALTQRYTGGSPETLMEHDLAALRPVKEGEEFLKWMDRNIALELTDDFWHLNLPARLDSSAANSPMLHCYHAALSLLDARALFSEVRVWDAMDPSTKAYKNKVERHHLFPKNYLKQFGFTKPAQTNRIANYALVEWKDNISISDTPPSEYFEKYAEKLDPQVLKQMMYWHALPVSWETMDYQEFMEARRKLIANVMKDGFMRLSKGQVVEERPGTLAEMIAAGEGPYTEFKSTLRVNLHTNEKDPRMEHAILKTINGFLNSDGGTLVVGVKDDGEALGIEVDGFPNEDKMDLHLGNLIKQRLGPASMLHIKPRFEDYKGKRVLLVDCKPSKAPVYLQNGGDEEFYIRAGGSSAKLSSSQMTEYIKQRYH
ncbi:MAG: putative DNA binding domain-containing protein, partial [Flavobacteriales bacterium]|nr:putative DNA binding domain-containing protein [Flavobacteriales bacterium]